MVRSVRGRTVVTLAAALTCCPVAAGAAAVLTADGGRISFFPDALALAIRGDARIRLADGTALSGASAYIDLRGGRGLVAGGATIGVGPATRSADAIAFAIAGPRVDLLDLASGAQRTTRALEPPEAEPIPAGAFFFPDLDDGQAFIRSRHAEVALGAGVRFEPASFPTSVGALPVPMYLYAYAPAAGFAASSLPGATFDQPYALFASPNALSALHFRFLQPATGSVGFQQHVVSGNDAFVVASVDAPLRGTSALGLSAYRRLGASATVSLDAAGSGGFRYTHLAGNQPFGAFNARTDYTINSAGGSTFDVTLRTRDRPLFGGATYRIIGDLGFDAQAGGFLSALPDRASYATVWRRRLEGFVASPVVRAPLRTRFAATGDVARTWSSFPHELTTAEGTATLSRTLSRSLTLFAGYDARWTTDWYPGNQAAFYPPAGVVLPDGSTWTGYAAYNGAATSRLANLDVQFAPNPATSLRVSLRASRDFPQFDGFGRPPYEAHADLRFKPVRNLSVTAGRSYDFGWAGVRWVPTWSLGLTP